VDTVILSIDCDYDRTQPLWHNLFVSRKIDPNELVGAHEIAERVGVAFPNIIHTWRRRHADFPQPVAELQAGMIWDWKEVKAWLEATNRLPT